MVKSKIILVLLCAVAVPQGSLNATEQDASWFRPWYLLGSMAVGVGSYFGYQWYKSYNSKHNRFLRAAASGRLAEVQAWLQEQEIQDDIDEGNGYQQTALALAANNGNENIVRVLLDAGSDVDFGSINGVTPLHYAVRSNSQGVVNRLIAANADVDAQTKGGSTPSHYAARQANLPIAELLRKAGADLTKKTNKGLTPRQLALEEKFKTSIETR